MDKTLPPETGISFWVLWPLAMQLSPRGNLSHRGDSEESPTPGTGLGWKVNA